MTNKRPFDPSQPIIRRKLRQLRGPDRPKSHRPGRPPKPHALLYRRITIRLHPVAYQWALRQSKKLGIGYQTAINKALLQHAAD